MANKNIFSPSFGVIGDRRTQFARESKKKKHSFRVYGVEIELDLKYKPLNAKEDSFGLVLCCLNEETGEQVSVRKISDVTSRRCIALTTLREMQILRQISHSNVMGFQDVMISSSLAGEADFRDLYLVEELMDFDFAFAIKTKKLSGNDCRSFLIQILRGVSFLHSANVIHRNLQPRNLLLNKKLELKICDFGHADTLDQKSYMLVQDMIDFPWYKAPEILSSTRLYRKEADMWSVGCIFAEMMTQAPIFKGSDVVEQLKEMIRILGTQSDPYSPGVGFSSLFPEADPLAIDLLKKMLVFDPLKRISAVEALKHPYFSGFEDPLTGCVSPRNAVLEDYEETVNEKMLRELIWKEMLFYHPQDQ